MRHREINRRIDQHLSRDCRTVAVARCDRHDRSEITAGAVATWNAGPAFGPQWYPVLLVVTALPCVSAGGLLRLRIRGAPSPVVVPQR